MSVYIGLDIGGTKCAVTLGRENADGSEMMVLEKQKIATPTDGPARTLDRLAGLVAQFARREPIAGIGISCGGPLDSSAGVILGPPNLPGWNDVPIADYFRRRFGVPARLQNDANACAVAEWKYGAGRGLRNMVFLTFGTGMGAGLILDGRLYTGACDMAGEVGHWRLAETGPSGYGKAGSFEGFCSGGGIARAAQAGLMEPAASDLLRAAGSPEGVTAKLVGELAEAGDPYCRSVYAQSGRMLGRGLALLVDLLNPQAIVIGSIFARSTNLLWENARAQLEEEALAYNTRACRVLPARLGERLGDIASLTVAMGRF